MGFEAKVQIESVYREDVNDPSVLFNRKRKTNLNYKPILNTQEGWSSTIDWCKEHWLPVYLERKKAGKGSAVMNKKKN